MELPKYACTYTRDTHTQAHTHQKKKEKVERFERKGGKKKKRKKGEKKKKKKNSASIENKRVLNSKDVERGKKKVCL